MPDLFDGINDWLMSRALGDADLSETIRQLAARLLDGGVPITRIVVGRALLHPLIGMTDLKWDIESRTVTVGLQVREMVRDAIREAATVAPFGYLLNNRIERLHADLTDPAAVRQFQIFGELAAQGVTGYAAFLRRFGTSGALDEDADADMQGAVVSFCTRRFSGFSPDDLSNLERLVVALFVCVRVATDRLLVTKLLDTYLGRISGARVLTGQSERGDGRSIECVLMMSDLRNSVSLSRDMSPQDYIATLNAYFDCAAGAVLDHGGEVLKFIGDGVLAIFPISEPTRPRAAMCNAALSAAREALARAGRTNDRRAAAGTPALDFGMALHVGDVIYGNVGVPQRLDFTATGAAVGMAARIEALTRDLRSPILATADFAAHIAEPGLPMPPQTLRGFADPVSLVGYAAARR